MIVTYHEVRVDQGLIYFVDGQLVSVERLAVMKGVQEDLLWPCVLHKGDFPIEIGEDGEGIPACQDCGKMFYTYDCPWCDETFLDFQAQGGFDDVMAAPDCTPDGDLVCSECAADIAKAEREEEEREGYDETGGDE